MRVSPLVTVFETHRAAPNIWARLGAVEGRANGSLLLGEKGRG